jgi:hypothetical protein
MVLVLAPLGLLITFALAIFFSAVYEANDQGVFCAFAWLCWWSLALYWIYMFTDLSFLAFLPFGIGWLYLVRVFLNLLNLPFLRRRRRATEFD